MQVPILGVIRCPTAPLKKKGISVKDRRERKTYPTPEGYEEILYQLIHADDGIERLRAFLEMDAVWQAYLQVIIRRVRAQGHSWQAIGDILGISRQAAHERFSPHEREDMPQEMDFWFDLLKQSYPRRDDG